MRVGIRVTGYGAPATAPHYRVRRVTSSMFRNFWFRVSVAGGTYTVDVYPTKLAAVNATAGQKLATATHAAGDQVEVTLTLVGGAPFDMTPATVSVDASGSWTGVIVLGFVDDPEAYLVDQVITVLNRYLGTNERLAELGVRTIVPGRDLPEAALPAIGVLLATTDVRWTPGGPYSEIGADLDLMVAVDQPDDAECMKTCASIAGALRSIVEEQRYWGWGNTSDSAGPVLGTEYREPMTVAREESPEGFLRTARLPLRIQMEWLADSQAPAGATGSGTGGGGKYGDPLIP